MVITEKAYAKLNISLDVLSKMPDGYHSMLMVMQSVSLCDDVTIEETEKWIRVRSNIAYLPIDSKNIASKAATAFLNYTGIKRGVTININKRIPVCAGMGGGSSDAAAVLRGMNKLFDTKLPMETLEKIGYEVGSDVPFCVSGGTSLAEGRGEILTPLRDLPDCDIVICKPEFSISTPLLFGRIRCDKIKRRPDTDGILSCVGSTDIKGTARRMYNVFEDVLPKTAEDIFRIRDTLIDFGADGAVMTGTGSAVFGIFTDKEAASNALDALSGSYKLCYRAAPVKRIENCD